MNGVVTNPCKQGEALYNGICVPAVNATFSVGSGSSSDTSGKVLSVAGAALCMYHGYVRNQSIVWALAWGALGALFPIPTSVIAVAQMAGKVK